MVELGVLEKEVYETALQTVAGVENLIVDSDWEDGLAPSWQEMYDMCYVDVIHECPKAIRFLGEEGIHSAIAEAMREFSYGYGVAVEGILEM